MPALPRTCAGEPMKRPLIAIGFVAALGALGVTTLAAGDGASSPGRAERHPMTRRAPALTAAEPPTAAVPASQPETLAPAPDRQPEISAPALARDDSNGQARFVGSRALGANDDPRDSARIAERSPEAQATPVMGGSIEGARPEDFLSSPTP